LKPGTVNRELDTLKSILSKAVEWRKLVDSAARGVKRLKVDNRRKRIVTPDEQRRLLESVPRKMRAFVAVALISGARVGELLGLRWPSWRRSRGGTPTSGRTCGPSIATP
jgi:integrase